MKYFLKTTSPQEDVEFLNNTTIEFSFIGSENDSGWCDAATGARIVSADDAVVFYNVSDQDALALIMRFNRRIEKVVDIC